MQNCKYNNSKKSNEDITDKIEEMNEKGEYDLLCIVFFLTVGLSLYSELFGSFIEGFSRHSKQTHIFMEKNVGKKPNSPPVPLRSPLHLRQSTQ